MALPSSEEELSNKDNEKRMYLHADHEEGSLKVSGCTGVSEKPGRSC